MATDNFDDDPDYNTLKLKQRMNSLKTQRKNINNQVWNAESSYYLSLGDAGLKRLDEIKKKEIEADYNERKKQYEKMMKFLYEKYYDKLSVLYIQKTMTNKQIEIINNTQYKVLEQREVDNNVTNELTTKNRERQYYDNLLRIQQKEIKLYSYITFIFIILIIIIMTMNYSKIKDRFFEIISSSHKGLPVQFMYVIIILFVIIVFRQLKLAILILIIYAVITIFVDSGYSLQEQLDKSNR
tara:strand:- start:2666 stop:3385 length:720 start_codon:yes stop_codon:yes gene_type:complete